MLAPQLRSTARFLTTSACGNSCWTAKVSWNASVRRNINTILPITLQHHNHKYNNKSSLPKQQQTRQSSYEASSIGEPDEAATLTNGKYLNVAMLYHDSVTFLVSNHLGIPTWMATRHETTPTELADQFHLSLRAASAILVTLSRMEVVQILRDDDDSVDDIVWELTPSAKLFLGAPKDATTCTTPFVDTFHTNFMDPEKLLQSFRRPASEEDEKKDIMSEHLEQSDEEVANNARHFMAHMNAQSVCCAHAFAKYLVDEEGSSTPATLLDIGGGSAIFTITAAKANPALTGVVLELPAIKPITEEYIERGGLSSRITVEEGDFFTDKRFPEADLVLFSNILHDWPDDINMDLLQKAFASLRPGGRVIINEILLADDVRSSTSSATSMNIIMLPYTKGRQYRAKELFRRLERIGFIDPCSTHLVDDYSLVMAQKP